MTPRGGQSLINSHKTHCKRGHPFTPANTRLATKPNGVTVRQCRECDQLRNVTRRPKSAASARAQRATIDGRLARIAALHRTRAKKAGVTSDPHVDLLAIAVRDNWRCQECGTRLARLKVAFDHVVPMFRGGANDASNIEVCCVPCNVARWTTTGRTEAARLGGTRGSRSRWHS